LPLFFDGSLALCLQAFYDAKSSNWNKTAILTPETWRKNGGKKWTTDFSEITDAKKREPPLPRLRQEHYGGQAGCAFGRSRDY